MNNPRNGWNVLCYGAGSKAALLDRFHQRYLADHHVCVVLRGYDRAATVDSLLDCIIEGPLRGRGGDTMDSRLAALEAVYGPSTPGAGPDGAVAQLFLLVHNVDAEALRPERSQSALARLAAMPGVHVVASVDMMQAALCE